MTHQPGHDSFRADTDPLLAALITDAYATDVDLDVSARHLYNLAQEVAFTNVTRDLFDDADDSIFSSDFSAELMDVPGDSATDIAHTAAILAADDSHTTTIEDEAGAMPLAERKAAEARRRPWYAPSFLSPSMALSGVPVISVALMVVIGASSVAMASQYSTPGDMLYGVKRSTEQARLALTFTKESRSQLQVELANTRLQELKQVGSVKPEVVPALIEDLNEAIEGAASEPAAVQATLQIASEAQAEVNKLDVQARHSAAVVAHVRHQGHTPGAKPVVVRVPQTLQQVAVKPVTPAPASDSEATKTLSAMASAAASAAAAIMDASGNGAPTTITIRQGNRTAVVVDGTANAQALPTAEAIAGVTGATPSAFPTVTPGASLPPTMGPLASLTPTPNVAAIASTKPTNAAKPAVKPAKPATAKPVPAKPAIGQALTSEAPTAEAMAQPALGQPTLPPGIVTQVKPAKPTIIIVTDPDQPTGQPTIEIGTPQSADGKGHVATVKPQDPIDTSAEEISVSPQPQPTRVHELVQPAPIQRLENTSLNQVLKADISGELADVADLP